jgi:hypothetical protein
MAENMPQTAYYAFEDSPIDKATLHVPDASVNLYKEAEPWKNFMSIAGMTTSVAQIKVNAVLIQSEGGRITVNGVDDGTNISVYGTDGVLRDTAISRNGSAAINTNLQTGSVVIVKIGENPVKVVVK